MSRILALDVGQKRVGVAVSDEMCIIASPLETILVHQLLEFLEKYIEREEVDCIVIGEPRDMNNNASDATRFIEPVVRSIRKRFREMRIERFDERFTSGMAFQVMIDAGLGKTARRDKGLVDKISAAIILQGYLESQSRMKTL